MIINITAAEADDREFEYIYIYIYGCPPLTSLIFAVEKESGIRARTRTPSLEGTATTTAALLTPRPGGGSGELGAQRIGGIANKPYRF